MTRSTIINRSERGLLVVSQALGLLAIVFAATAVTLWFTSGTSWKILGLKISLHEWVKPWLIAAGLWIARGLVAPGPSWIGRKADLVAALDGRAGMDLARAGGAGAAGRWVLWGIVLGGLAGSLFAVHYYYLVHWRVVQVASVMVIAAGSALVHLGFYLMSEFTLGKLKIEEKRRRTIAHAVYTLVWFLLVASPLRGWEARMTEPIFLQCAIGLAAGLLLAWWWAMRKRMIMTALAVIALVVAGAGDYAAGSRINAPHDRVIFVTLDTVRADHLSCYGYTRPTSPNLDALAASGMKFTRAFAPMAATDPSHITMLTGLYPREHGVKVPAAGKLAKSVPTIADVFSDHGFATAAITSRMLLDPWRIGLSGFGESSSPHWENTAAPEARRRAMNWLWKERGRDVFLWLHFFDPHQPYEPRPGFTEKFGAGRTRAKSGDKWLDADKHYDQNEIQERIDLYDGEIGYMDHYLGKLLADINALEPAPARAPLIIVVADHGEMLAEKQDPPVGYGFGHAGVLYQPAVHVPLIVSWPGVVAAGKSADDAVELVDLAPTIADLVFDAKFGTHGRDLAPMLRGGHADANNNTAVLERDHALGTHKPELKLDQYAVIAWPYKLLFIPDGAAALYDLASDPGETRDLAAERPDTTDEFKARWEQWTRDVPAAPTPELDLTPDELQKLRDLGYIQ